MKRHGDQDGAFAPIIQRHRKLRKECFAPHRTESTCHAASRSAASRFRQRMNANAGISLVQSTCDIRSIARELEATRGESDVLTRLVGAYRLREAKGDAEGANEDKIMYESVLRKVLSEMMIEGNHFLDRVRNVPNEFLMPDPWTMDMLQFNGYEHGRRPDVGIYGRRCESEDCLSRHVEGKFTLAECLNVDAAKVLMGGGDLTSVGAANHYGRPYCVLCTISNVYQRCIDPLGNREVGYREYTTSFSFHFVDVKPEYQLECRLTLAETGTQLAYRFVNVDVIVPLLRWVPVEGTNLHRIDFSVLA